ncbi:MAG: hypothetical protein EA425_14350 [Puniceicoccaceae bacterium]|nr:MAG: hypothetical protein EA425_14350 [Puniceicoccaceae bacterium]
MNPSEQSIANGEWRRLHPLNLLLDLFGALRSLVIPILVGAISLPGRALMVILPVLGALSVTAIVIRYWKRQYKLSEKDLVVREGLLARKVRNVPYWKIQNIDTVRNPLHRLFGVVGVRLESASGSEPEAVLEALSVEAVEELEAAIRERGGEAPAEARVGAGTAGEGNGAAEEAPARLLYRIRGRELVRLGLAWNRGLVIVGALVAYLFSYGRVEERLPMIERWLRATLDRVTPFAGDVPAWLPVVAGVVLALALLVGLSILYVFFRYHGFTLEGTDDRLRTVQGLFTRATATIPRRRVQRVMVTQNLILRWLGGVSVRVETAGHSEHAGGWQSERYLAPYLPQERLDAFMTEVLPDWAWSGLEWRPVSTRAKRRLLRIRLSAVLVVIGVAGWLTTPWALALLPLLVGWVVAYVKGYVTYAGFALGPDTVAYRSGWLKREQSLVAFSRVQVVALEESPFDRRWKMANVNVDTAGASMAAHWMRLRHLERSDAEEVWRTLDSRVRDTDFKW